MICHDAVRPGDQLTKPTTFPWINASPISDTVSVSMTSLGGAAKLTVTCEIHLGSQYFPAAPSQPYEQYQESKQFFLQKKNVRALPLQSNPSVSNSHAHRGTKAFAKSPKSNFRDPGFL